MDNVFAGFSAMGITYVQMVRSFFTRIFEWLLDFFDYKVIPNPPKDPGSVTKFFNNINPWNPLNRVGWETMKPNISERMLKFATSPDHLLNSISSKHAQPVAIGDMTIFLFLFILSLKKGIYLVFDSLRIALAVRAAAGRGLNQICNH